MHCSRIRPAEWLGDDGKQAPVVSCDVSLRRHEAAAHRAGPADLRSARQLLSGIAQAAPAAALLAAMTEICLRPDSIDTIREICGICGSPTFSKSPVLGRTCDLIPLTDHVHLF